MISKKSEDLNADLSRVGSVQNFPVKHGRTNRVTSIEANVLDINESLSSGGKVIPACYFLWSKSKGHQNRNVDS